MAFRRHPGNSEGRHPGSASYELLKHLVKSQENILSRACGRGPGSGDTDRGVGLASTEREVDQMESKNCRLLINLKDGASLPITTSMVHHICRDGDASWVKTHDGVRYEVSEMEAERLLERMFES